MCRSFLLLTFLGVLFSTLYSKTAAIYRFREFRTGDKNFSLSCLLFGNIGCDLDCIIISRLYDYKSRGRCVVMNGQENICYCGNENAPVHPYTTWKKKFDSDYVYSHIMINRQKAGEAVEILDDPQRTGEELKNLLEPLLSPYQSSKLKIIDSSPAAKYIKNGKVDRQSVQKFISDQLDGLLKQSMSSLRPLLQMNYRNSFKKVLYNVKDIGTLYNFVYKVTGLGNEALKNDLEAFLKRYDIEEPELDEEEEPLVMNILHYLMINEFIKRNDAMKNNQRRTRQ